MWFFMILYMSIFPMLGHLIHTCVCVYVCVCVRGEGGNNFLLSLKDNIPYSEQKWTNPLSEYCQEQLICQKWSEFARKTFSTQMHKQNLNEIQESIQNQSVDRQMYTGWTYLKNSYIQFRTLS